MTSSQYERDRDEQAKKYGIKVAKHMWERLPAHTVTGEYRQFDERADFRSESAFRHGFDAGHNYALNSEVVSALVDALEKISEVESPDWYVEDESGCHTSVGDFANDALAKFKDMK